MLENLDALCESEAATGVGREYSPVYLTQSNKIEGNKQFHLDLL
jgi:hypothetical protein